MSKEMTEFENLPLDVREFLDEHPVTDKDFYTDTLCPNSDDYITWEQINYEAENNEYFNLPDMNWSEFEAIYEGLVLLNDKWDKRNEIVIPYYGDRTPSCINGLYTLANKLGIRLLHKYTNYDYIQWERSKKKYNAIYQYERFYSEQELEEINKPRPTDLEIINNKIYDGFIENFNRLQFKNDEISVKANDRRFYE